MAKRQSSVRRKSSPSVRSLWLTPFIGTGRVRQLTLQSLLLHAGLSLMLALFTAALIVPIVLWLQLSFWPCPDCEVGLPYVVLFWTVGVAAVLLPFIFSIVRLKRRVPRAIMFLAAAGIFMWAILYIQGALGVA